jgi:hypothetical protein
VPSLITDTRKNLAELASPDEFETLATAVLRAAESNYAALIHTGTNLDGRAVKSPVDGIGFSVIRGSRRLLMVQHTITARRALRRKWLDPENGDLIKAAAILREEQQRRPTQNATVVLASSVDPDEALIRDVHAAAIPGMTVDIWPGSRIADFLDRNPEGQWLRRQQFGTAASRLSPTAAREISRLSLDAYLPLVERRDVVSRRLNADLERFATGARGAGFVIGESGFGKSTALRRLGDSWVDDGGIALVLDEAMVAGMASIDQAVSAELRRWMPTLDTDCGQVALGLATPQRPLLLIVEDVNRSTNPRRVVERLVGWSVGDGKDRTGEWRALCPIWRGNAAVNERGLRDKVLSSSISVERFERNEAITALREKASASGMEPTTLQLENMAAAFGDDPLLIALNTNWSNPDPRDAIRSYVGDNLDQAADDRLLAVDLRQALDELASRMVVERNVFPTWKEMRTWFAPGQDGIDAIRRLVDHGRVVRLGEDGRLAYRHDRVRDHLLASAIGWSISRDRLPVELWEEPFYAELIGEALRDLPPQAMEAAGIRNPVALFAALEDPSLTDGVQSRFVDAAARWAGSAVAQAGGEESRRHHAMRCLARTDGKFVIDLALPLQHSFLRLEALARNGHAGAAAAICSTSEPGMRDGWRDRVISHALARHPEMTTKLAAMLRNGDVTEKSLEGALNLAGEIGDPALCDALAERWERDGYAAISTGWLWATLRCCPPIGHPLADEVCAAWAQLPARVGRGPDKLDRNPRWDIAGYSLTWAFSRKPDPDSVKYLLGLPKKHRRLAHVVESITSHIDTPEAVLHSVRRSAAISRKIAGTKGINLRARDLERTWSPDEHGKALGETSRAALEKVWRNRRVNRFDRKSAFGIWCLTPTAAELAELPELEADETLADQALKARLAAGDQSAVPLLSARIWSGESSWWWWWQARKVGLDGLREDVLRYLEERHRDGQARRNRDPDRIIAELLMDRGDEFAMQTIVGNWHMLGTTPDYVQAALYLATPETVVLGQAAVRDSGDADRMLRYIDSRWGIKTYGRVGVTRLAQLRALEPFYAGMQRAQHGDLYISTFFDAANRIGELAWRREHLDPLIAENGRGHCTSDEQSLFATLDEEVAWHLQRNREYFGIDHWFQRREEELWRRDELLRAVGEWARLRGSEPAVGLLCEALTQFGERRELDLLGRLNPAMQETCADKIANCHYDVRRRSIGEPARTS